MVTGFYKDLFFDNDPYIPFALARAFPNLDENDMTEVSQEVTLDEIHQTLKSIGGFKAPGPDGIQAIFYQKQWRVVGNDFCDLIFFVLQDPNKVGELNDTLLVLILKEDVVTNMKQFGLISLCNVSYKTITKLVARRIRWLMLKLVGLVNVASFPKDM